jgi:hypothetical protein
MSTFTPNERSGLSEQRKTMVSCSPLNCRWLPAWLQRPARR